MLLSASAELDDLEWEAGAAVAGFGVRVGVRTTDRKALPALLQRLPRGLRPARSPVVDRLYSYVGRRGSHRLYVDGELDADFRRRELLLGWLHDRVQLFVAETARDRVFLHAAAVAWRGRAAILPAKTEAGKSTLTMALVRAGASYLSDEFAVVDRRGRVHPFPRPIMLREDGRAVGHEVETLGGTQLRRSAPVALIVLTSYRPGAHWRPRPISSGRALLALMATAVPTRSDPARTIETLAAVVTQAAIVKSARGEAEEAAEAILGLLEAQSSARLVA